MIYMTQLIYIVQGQEEIFHQFEAFAIPILSKYNGKLLLRIRPNDHSIIENNIAKPYEIHLVEFDSHESFERFKSDEERMNFLHLKEKSIQTSILIQGTQI